jgi:hypothetical protein
LKIAERSVVLNVLKCSICNVSPSKSIIIRLMAVYMGIFSRQPCIHNSFQMRHTLRSNNYNSSCTGSIWAGKLYSHSNPAQTRCTRYNIMWWSLSMTCGRSVVFSEHSDFLHQYNSSLRYNNFQSEVKHYNPLPLTSSGYWNS